MKQFIKLFAKNAFLTSFVVLIASAYASMIVGLAYLIDQYYNLSPIGKIATVLILATLVTITIVSYLEHNDYL